MTPATQQRIYIMLTGTLCGSVVLSLVMMGLYAVFKDGQAANTIMDIMKQIITEGLPALGGLGGLHLYLNRTQAPAPALSASPAAPDPLPLPIEPNPGQGS